MLEPIEKQYLRIGRVNRAQGIHGEVLIIPEFNAPTLFEDIDLAFVQNARGDLIPARIESVRVDTKNNRLSFFVKFEHVSDRSGAEELKNCPIFVDRDKCEGAVGNADTPGSYTAFKVFDDDGHQIGKVDYVIDNPAHPILQIHNERDEQLLVPFVEEYIRSVDEEQKTITCRNLDQLSDLKS